MHWDRLQALALLMDESDDSQIDMLNWDSGWRCCAVGLAARHAPFRAAGLALAPRPGSVHALVPRYRPPGGPDRYGWSAVEHFFGLTSAKARYLFDVVGYPSSQPPHTVVASRIRELLYAKACPGLRRLLAARAPRSSSCVSITWLRHQAALAG